MMMMKKSIIGLNKKLNSAIWSTANSNSFLEAIAEPVVVTQPQAFSDAMLDPASRGLMASLATTHVSGAALQGTIRQSAEQLQRTIQGQFVSLKIGLLVGERVVFIFNGVLFSKLRRKVVSPIGSLSIHDVYESENVI